MKDFLLLKKDHFVVDKDGYATVIDKPEAKKNSDLKIGKKVAPGRGHKSTCEVIQLD